MLLSASPDCVAVHDLRPASFYPWSSIQEQSL